jgi:hypothetical protein
MVRTEAHPPRADNVFSQGLAAGNFSSPGNSWGAHTAEPVASHAALQSDHATFVFGVREPDDLEDESILAAICRDSLERVSCPIRE